MTKKCANCGAENPDNADFCKDCGVEFRAQPEPSEIKAWITLPNNEHITIEENETILGRKDVARTLTEEDALYVSRQHIKIIKDADKFWIEDLDSDNGTHLNGEPIKGKGKLELKPDSEIVLAREAIGEKAKLRFLIK